eukprot:jgi/Psemu1/301410/fgenesh1_kg.33_\
MPRLISGTSRVFGCDSFRSFRFGSFTMLCFALLGHPCWQCAAPASSHPAIVPADSVRHSR